MNSPKSAKSSTTDSPAFYQSSPSEAMKRASLYTPRSSVKRKIDEDHLDEVRRLSQELRNAKFLVEDLQASIQEKTDALQKRSKS